MGQAGLMEAAWRHPAHTIRRVSKAITLRIPDDDLKEIDRRAQTRRITRTEYLISCALGRDVETIEVSDRQRMDEIERFLARLDSGHLILRVAKLEMRLFGRIGFYSD